MRPGGGNWAGNRPGWGGGGGWNGYRPGWGAAAAGLGIAGAAAYGASYGYPYGSGYGTYGYSGYGGYGDCQPVQQQVWNGYGYQVQWVNPCGGY